MLVSHCDQINLSEIQNEAGGSLSVPPWKDLRYL